MKAYKHKLDKGRLAWAMLFIYWVIYFLYSHWVDKQEKKAEVSKPRWQLTMHYENLLPLDKNGQRPSLIEHLRSQKAARDNAGKRS